MEELQQFATRWAHVNVLEAMLFVMLREGANPSNCFIDCDDMDAYKGRAHLLSKPDEGKRIMNIIDGEFPPYHDYKLISKTS